MPPQNLPAADVPVDEDVVRRLLTAQHPDLADLPLVLLANGWDNVMYRLGPELVVRLPRREIAAEIVWQQGRHAAERHRPAGRGGDDPGDRAAGGGEAVDGRRDEGRLPHTGVSGDE
jgi:hypothetical protein